VPAANAGFFPLDGQLELRSGDWSEGLEREAVWLSGAVSSYAMVSEILKRVGQVEMSSTSIWRVTQAAGERFQAWAERERERANCLPEQWEPPSRAEVKDQRMGVAMDGAIIPLRDESWKEVKIGNVFDIALSTHRDKESGEMIELAHAVNNIYVAHLGGPDPLGEQTWAETRRRGWEKAQDTLVIGDGAPWIWNQAALHFGESHQLTDWYHAVEHLTRAARLLKQEGTPAYRRWLNSRKRHLYQDHAERIAGELNMAAAQLPTRADEIRQEATYFRNNQHRMNYLEMREEEWPIGSGMVESGAKQFRARFCGPGMRWSRKGAESLLPIRAAVLSRSFDSLWNASLPLPLN
jgi:hypothetical protein